MRSNQGKLYLTGAFALAGTSVVTGYLLSEKLSGFTITAVSMGIVLAGLLPFYAGKTVRTIRLLTKRDWRMIVLQALLGIVLFRLFLLLGVRRTSTAEAGILTGTTPAITAVLAFFILKERLSAASAAGIAGTVAGILLLQNGGLPDIRFSGDHLLGNTLILCAAASESTFNILSRRHAAGEGGGGSARMHPMVQTILVSAVSLALTFLPALLERPFSALVLLGLTEWLALGWYGLVVTALAFAFFFAGARRCGAYTIAAFSGIMPLTAMLLSTVFLRERITAVQWAGSALILLGVTLIGRTQRRTPC